MAEVDTAKIPSLAEHYLLEKGQKQKEAPEPVEEPEVTPIIAAPVEETIEKTEETPSVVDNEAPLASSAEAEVETSAGDIVENQESNPADNPISTPEESNDSVESEDTDNQESEETPEIKLETAPADFRFPTTNQTRHCFTRYIEYHRCIAAKGKEAPECQKFAKYYRAICPGEWVERWNEQRENGTFPGPL